MKLKYFVCAFIIFLVDYSIVSAKDDVCKRVKDSSKLHTIECSANNNNDFCSGAGYRINGSKGTNIITYGQIGRGEELKPGDAYNCDVNGDGAYDDDTERFYFVSKMNENVAVLIHSSVGTSSKFSSSEGTGPSLAKNKLPSSDEWNNISLTNTSRIIKNGELGLTISSGTREITNPFSYEGYTSRFLSLEDLKNMDSSLYSTYLNPARGDLDNYIFLLENTRFETGNNTKYQGYWTETLKDSNPEFTYGQVPVFFINGQRRTIDAKQWSANDFGVKPVIEVRLSDIGVYSIKYNLDGGTADNPIKYTEDTDTFTLEEPELYGYKFIGWTGSNGDVPQKVVTIEEGTTGDLEFTANYEVIKYHVVIYDDDNKIYDDYVIIDNEVSKPPTPSKAGYTFDNWYVGDEVYDFIKEVKSDLIIRARYTLDDYDINYDLDGGMEEENPTSYTVLSEDIVLKAPTKEKYNFIGWTGSNGDTPEMEVTIKKGSTGNKSYKANFEKIKFNVIILDQDNTLFDDKVEIDSTITKPEDPYRVGYTFDNWYVDDEVYDFSKPIDSNLLIKSKYKLNNYTITLDANGGTLNGDSIINYNYETPTFELETPTKAGYEFVGWSDGESIVKDVSFEKGTTGNFTYTAIYTPKEDTKYIVNHYKMNLNGEYVLETTEFFYGKTDTSVTPNVKEYTGFISPDTKTINIDADGNASVDYKYDRKKYELKINENDNSLIIGAEGNYYYGDQVTVSIEPELGYDFIKWSNGETDKEITISITDDLELSAEIRPTEYIFTDGVNATIMQGEDIEFKTNGEYSLAQYLYIDDKLVDKKYYELSEGSTIIKLKKSYTKSLKNGKHSISISYKNGSKPVTSFNVKEINSEVNPKTLDNIVMYIAITVLSLVIIISLIVIVRRINRKK